MSPRLSLRTNWDGSESSYAAALREARASGLQKSNRSLCDLTRSNPTQCGFTYDSDTILNALTNPAGMAYQPDPHGSLPAREAVSAYYSDHDARVGADSITLTTSTSEAYSYIFKLLCDASDEVLIAQPGYPLFNFLADMDLVQLRPYPLFYDHGWWIDFAEVERAITPRTRAILIVHPNNPTGHWTGAAERDRLQEICLQHGLALIVDEVFLDYPLRELPADNQPKTFASGEHPVLTFILSGISKVAALPQMKVAWLAVLGPEPERLQARSRLEIIADTFLSLSTPAQLALPVWLAGRTSIQRQILERARGNLALLDEFAQRSSGAVRVLQADAGWSAVLALSICTGESDCAERLIRDCGVAIQPGAFYGMGEANRVIVSLIGPPDEFMEGLSRLGLTRQ